MYRRSLVTLVLAAMLGALAGAPAACAHALLVGASPSSGSTLATQPGRVIFEFNEPVGGTLGAVRVYDAAGREVDDLAVSHPAGRARWLGVGLKPGLPAGSYTATYRVTSADTHIVAGGLVFNIGHAGTSPRFTVAGLIDRNDNGPVTRVAFAAIHALGYLAIALVLGGLAFVLLAWLPALSAIAGSESRRQAAKQAFARRFELLLWLAVSLGVLTSVLGVLLQGASAAGVSLWSSLQGTILSDTLHSRFGAVWGARALDWVLLGGLLLMLRHRPAPWPRRLLAAAGLPVAYLAITPALAGHASVEGPVAVFFTASVLHVLAASAWVGGIACLLLVLPRATRQLEPGARTRLLHATLLRFSALGLLAVLVIAASGVVQAYIDIRSFDGLLHSTYGALVIVKVGLLALLIGLGAVNRRRVIPALERLTDDRPATTGRPPGSVGVLARRTLRGELALMLGVFGVTGALVGYTPPIDAASGPFATTTAIGPLELELTVDPARVGVNTIHLYLIDAKRGTPFAGTKQLTVTAALKSKQIGPLPLRANLSGPGHYTLNSTSLTPGGRWDLQITDRVSDFDEYVKTVKVPIR